VARQTATAQIAHAILFPGATLINGIVMGLFVGVTGDGAKCLGAVLQAQ